MIGQASGIILCGGLGTRMGGTDKGLLRIGREPFLDILMRTLQPLFTELLVVTRTPQAYADRGCRIVTDLFELRSSLTGIHAGLVHARNEHAFITACDTPLLRRGLVSVLLDMGKPEDDVIVPRENDLYEPLCAVYSRRCLPIVEDLLSGGKAKVSGLFRRVRVREIPVSMLRGADPGLESFLNINTPSDLERIRRAFAGYGEGTG